MRYRRFNKLAKTLKFIKKTLKIKEDLPFSELVKKRSKDENYIDEKEFWRKALSGQ